MKVMNDDGTVSGSFINMMITFVYLGLIIASIFVPFVADAIKKMESFMTWFFVASFGIWKISGTISNLGGGQQ
jgi:hypothetical protein